MNKQLFEKLFIVSIFGVLITIFLGLVGYDSLRAALPFLPSAKNNANAEVVQLERNFAEGIISKHEYDSLSVIYKTKLSKSLDFNDKLLKKIEIPNWLKNLGFEPPKDMQIEPIFSEITSVKNAQEGFNSVELVYLGNYDTAVARATQYAKNLNLEKHSLVLQSEKSNSTGARFPLTFLNYHLGKPESEYLISVQVLASGKLTVMVTNNKQLNDRLLTYQPLNTRIKSPANHKK